MDEDREAFNAIIQAGIDAAITALESDDVRTFLSKQSADFQAGFNLAVDSLKNMAESLQTEGNDG